MPEKRPNILFVLTDQQRADTVHAGGNPHIRTPVMDRLCAEGVRFDRAYTPSPVCVSARCAVVTGQYPHRTGCFDNGYPMPDDGPSMMDLLRQGGYQTHGVGKMHFVPDRAAMKGFETREIQEELAADVEDDDFLKHVHDNGFPHVHDVMGARGEMYYIPQISQLPARLHATSWTADRSLAFLEGRDPSRPFFLWTSFIHPHPPFSPPTPWNKLYRGPLVPLPRRPDDMEDLWTYHNRHQNRYKYRDAGQDDNLLRVMRGYYWACVSFVDYSVGRILAHLEHTGELDDTLVLWTSDHGEFLGDYNCFGKRSFLDPAARVPLMVRYPDRFPAGVVAQTPVSLLDLFPTFLGAAGVPASGTTLDGEDLAGLVGQSVKRTIYGQFQRGDRGVYMAYDGRRKYVYSAADDKEYLLDHSVDPDETRNRAYNPLCLSDTAEMRDALIGHFRSHGYTEPLDGEGWKRFPPPKVPQSPDAGLLIQDARWSLPHYRIEGYSQ
jgi:choline-sulfatase